MKISGACHCGEISYEAEIDKDKVVICHCTDCQIMSGSAYRISVSTPNKLFRLIKGLPKTYIKIGDSGNKRLMAFCGNCGSHVYATDAITSETISIRVGTINERASLFPFLQVWNKSSLSWSKDLRKIASKEMQNA